MSEIYQSAKKLQETCFAMRQLIEMSYEYKDGVCPSNLLEKVFDNADRLADEIREHLESEITIKTSNIAKIG